MGCAPGRTDTLPLSSSSMPGTVLHGIPVARQLARASRICAPVADGMAIMISPTAGLRRFRWRTTEMPLAPSPAPVCP